MVLSFLTEKEDAPTFISYGDRIDNKHIFTKYRLYAHDRNDSMAWNH